MRMGKIAVGKRVGGTAEHGRNKPANVMAHGAIIDIALTRLTRRAPTAFVDAWYAA